MPTDPLPVEAAARALQLTSSDEAWERLGPERRREYIEDATAVIATYEAARQDKPDGDWDFGPFDPDELVRWAETYGHPEHWAVRAKALHAKLDALAARAPVPEQEAGARAIIEALVVEAALPVEDRSASVFERAKAYLTAPVSPDREADGEALRGAMNGAEVLRRENATLRQWSANDKARADRFEARVRKLENEKLAAPVSSSPDEEEKA